MCATRAFKKRKESIEWKLRPRRNNKLGLKGVDFRFGAYRAKITWNKNQYELGRFETKEDAYQEFLRAFYWILNNPELNFEEEFE